MISKTSQDFRRLFVNLPKDVRKQAQRAYRLWLRNPRHPGLQYKRVGRQQAVYSVRIGKHWRALGLVERDTVYWFWIGTHAGYDNLLGRL